MTTNGLQDFQYYLGFGLILLAVIVIVAIVTSLRKR